MPGLDTSPHMLILMRHAKSDWYSGAADDFSRPLSDRGRRDARRMGLWMAQQGPLPGAVVCSPSRRTRETLELLGDGAGVALAPLTEWPEALYHGSVCSLRAVVRACDLRKRVLLIGHNPALEEFLRWLVPADGLRHGFSKTIPTAAVYLLELRRGAKGVTKGAARIVAHQRPKLLTG